jgi:hypothetical protein
MFYLLLDSSLPEYYQNVVTHLFNFSTAISTSEELRSSSKDLAALLVKGPT